jgi:uncharacterized protein YkwD
MVRGKKHASAHPKITVPLKRVKVPKKLAAKFVHYFVPHKKNDYKPLFLRAGTVGATTALILVLFVGADFADQALITNRSPQFAAVVVSTLVDLANTDRTQNGLPMLTVSPVLEQAAQLKANDEAAKSYFAHISPAGDDPWHWFSQAGYDFSYAGENLAVYFSDSDAVNTAWMNSPEHRANILSDNFTQIGIATAEGVYQGQQTVFVVQEFGTPAAFASASASQDTSKNNSGAQTAPVARATPAPSAVDAIPVAIAAEQLPNQAPIVKGTSTETAETAQVAPTPEKVTVLQETPTFIAVENTGAPAPTIAAATAGSTPAAPAPNPVTSALWKFVTSPLTDLAFVYGIIGAIVALSLILEVAVEVRRQHPHRIAMGLSLICLMVILIYAGHTFIAGQLTIV